MKSLIPLALSLCASSLAAQVTVARVDDAMTPGMLGDAHLSLDEAIRLVNGALTRSQLSAAEAARLAGSGPVAEIEIDAATTPMIMVMSALTPLDGPAAGVDVMLRGVNGMPAIHAMGMPYVLRVRTNTAQVMNLMLMDGDVGVLVDDVVHLAMGEMLMLEHLEFMGQMQAGLRLSASGMMADTPVMLMHSALHQQVIGVEIDDHSNGGAVMFEAEHVHWDGVQLAIDMFTDATGSMTMCRVYRSMAMNTQRFLQVRRGATSDQRLMAMIVGSEIHTSGTAFDAQGTAVVETAIHVHHSTIQPEAGARAFVVGPQDARIDFHISENLVWGDVLVSEGRLNRRLWCWNNVFRDGTFAVANLGTPTNFRWNRFENCTVRALAASTARMLHVSSEFGGCTLDGQSALGTLELENCFLEATSSSGNVVAHNPAPSRWLGSTSSSTEEPQLGGHVDLGFSLPFGMLGVWQIGFADPRVVLTDEPWRFYAHQSFGVLLHGMYALNSSLRLPIPNDQNLVGLELYCTAIAGPIMGQSHVPAFHLPRGVYLDIRN